MKQAQAVSAPAEIVPPELKRGKHRPFAALALVPRVVEDPPLTPEEREALTAAILDHWPDEEPVVDKHIEPVPTAIAPRPTPPKFSKDVDTNIREFLFHGLDRGVIPERGKKYGVYAGEHGNYSRLVIGTWLDRHDGVVYVRVLEVSGEAFRPLEVLRDQGAELAYELIRNPGAIRNKELRKRVEALSRFFHSLAKKMEGSGQKRTRQAKRT